MQELGRYRPLLLQHKAFPDPGFFTQVSLLRKKLDPKSGLVKGNGNDYKRDIDGGKKGPPTALCLVRMSFHDQPAVGRLDLLVCRLPLKLLQPELL